MAKLIYMMSTSLDGYIEDEQGDFAWATPDEEEHVWILQHFASFRTHLYGRKNYETMLYWETAQTLPNQPQSVLDFAHAWQTAEKIIYTTSLAEPRSLNTTLRRVFEPEEVRKLKASTENDICIAGPELAAQAINADLVDEIQVRICPVVVGGGKRFLPNDARLSLELLEERRFQSGDIFLRYSLRKG